METYRKRFHEKILIVFAIVSTVAGIEGTLYAYADAMIMNDMVQSYGLNVYQGHYSPFTEYVSPTSSLVGQSFNSMTVMIKKVGSPTGDITFGVFAPDLSVKKSFGSIAASSLTTSYKAYSFQLPSDQTYTISSGDRIGAAFPGGSSKNNVAIMTDQSNKFDAANSYASYFTTAWQSLLGADISMTLGQTYYSGITGTTGSTGNSKAHHDDLTVPSVSPRYQPISSIHGFGKGPASVPASDYTLSPAPINLTATAIDGNGVKLDWLAQDGNVHHYRIERALIGSALNTTEFQVTGSINSTQYLDGKKFLPPLAKCVDCIESQSYTAHWYIGSITAAGGTATKIHSKITAPRWTEYSDTYSYQLTSIYDNSGMYDQIGFANIYGRNYVIATTLGPCSNSGQFTVFLKEVPSDGRIYDFTMQVQANVTGYNGVLFTANDDQNDTVLSHWFSTGATTLLNQAITCGFYGYTDYVENWYSHEGAIDTPTNDFTFTQNDWTDGGGTHPSTWASWSAGSVPAEMKVTIPSQTVKITNMVFHGLISNTTNWETLVEDTGPLPSNTHIQNPLPVTYTDTTAAGDTSYSYRVFTFQDGQLGTPSKIANATTLDIPKSHYK